MVVPNRTNVVFTRGPRLLSHDATFVARCGDKPVVGSWGMRLRRQAYQLGFERIAAREVWLVRGINRFLAALDRCQPKREVFVIGGAQIYAQLLPRCSDVYLSVVFREVEGDAFLPSFEDDFTQIDTPLQTADFEVRHYRRRS